MQRESYTEAATGTRGWTAMVGTPGLTLFVTSLLTLCQETPVRRIVRTTLLPGLALSILVGATVARTTPSLPTNVDDNGRDRDNAARRIMIALEGNDYKPESSAAAYIDMLLHDPPQHLTRGDAPDGAWLPRPALLPSRRRILWPTMHEPRMIRRRVRPLYRTFTFAHTRPREDGQR